MSKSSYILFSGVPQKPTRIVDVLQEIKNTKSFTLTSHKAEFSFGFQYCTGSPISLTIVTLVGI